MWELFQKFLFSWLRILQSEAAESICEGRRVSFQRFNEIVVGKEGLLSKSWRNVENSLQATDAKLASICR